jgi:hypothetical protein
MQISSSVYIPTTCTALLPKALEHLINRYMYYKALKLQQMQCNASNQVKTAEPNQIWRTQTILGNAK